MLASCDNTYQADADVKHVGDNSIAYTECAHAKDQNNVSVCQLGLERWGSEAPKPLSMSRVLAKSTPFQIDGSIVGFDRINVIHDRKTLRIRNKRSRNQS